MKNTLLLGIISSFALSIRADVIPPRFGSNCAFTLNKIYCYGGRLENKKYSNDIYQLDLNKLSPGPVNDTIKHWSLVTVNPSPGVPQDEYRFDSQFVPLPDGSLFFDGGYNENNPLVARNATYDPQKNVWTVLPGDSYNDAQNGGYRQIYGAATVHLPDTNSILFYGGRQLNVPLGFTYTSNKPLANLTYETTSDLDPSKKLVQGIYGYNYVTELNLDTRKWTAIKTEPLLVNDFPTLISDQTGVYHPGSRSIIYLAGFIKDELLVGMTRPLFYYLIFDTENSIWKRQETIGLNTPTARVGHTATMLNTGDDILMYGGYIQPRNESLDGNLSVDYLYTLNLKTFRWSVYNKPPSSIGPRAFHSAVLVNDTSLFIMFGKTMSKTSKMLVPSNDIMILNVTDLASLTALDTYPIPIKDSETNKTSTTNGQSDDQSKGLSGGAIAGVVVGSVAAIAIIILAAILYRKRNNSKEEKMRELPVNWDAIDGEYRDNPPFGAGLSTGSKTVTSPVILPDSAEKQAQSVNTYSPALAASNLIKPDVDQNLQPKRIKPDLENNN